MPSYKCSCCGKTIEPGPLTDVQFAALDALNAGLAAFQAAADTTLRAVCEPTLRALHLQLDLVTLLERQAPEPQALAIRERLRHFTERLAGPS